MSSDGTNGPVIIQGIQPDNPGTDLPLRIEVREMIKDFPDQWNLFLLGMERFERVEETVPVSYFEICGIHALPYKKWPDRPWNDKMVQVNENFGGFCTHSSILFLPWHRPYVALFEAELYKHINAVANEYPESERKADYLKAAKDFRMPYWDWARPDLGVFPVEATSQARLRVKRPGHNQRETLLRPNPLASYKFGSESKGDRDINRFPRIGGTVRYPGESNSDELMEQLTAFFSGTDTSQFSRGKNLTERVVFILQSYRDFGSASNNRFNPPEGSSGQPNFAEWGSFEDIHNAIHAYTGGEGHMSDTTVAAFDPIFWLHHTNVDRLFAIWQACHDNPRRASTYVTDQTASNDDGIGGSFFIKAGGLETINTALAPFAQSGTDDNQVFWTSAGVRYTDVFGYQYPETQKSRFPTREAILNEIDRLYGRTASLANVLRSDDQDIKPAVDELKSRAKAHLQVGKLSAAAAAAPAVSVPPRSSSIEPSSTVNLTATAADDVPAPPQAARSLARRSAEPEPAHVQLPEDRDLKKLMGPENKYLEWLVNMKAEKAELGGNYLVHVFLGDVDDANPVLYVKNHSHVGVFATFGQGETTPCKNCQEGRAAGQRITGQIPLTMALVERYLAGMIESLAPEHVVPYLQRHLHWRVTLVNGHSQSRRQLKNLLVGVVTNEVTVPTSPTGLPHYADDVVPWPEVTTRVDGSGRGHGTGYNGSNF